MAPKRHASCVANFFVSCVSVNPSWPKFYLNLNLEVSGIIESHGYPWFYLPEEKCSWTIDLPPGITMMIEFPDFSLQGKFFILPKYNIVNDKSALKSTYSKK